ncbi:pentatricopeptide repeat-containing protein 1, mitochondrial [Strongylocentrotus purpuratus]|uniref:PROP1-like PPR domain-containing protein n=1 Tax=Strongylocentrotus purpuratus TaxID=7668 RepID=A0A7M7SYK2_STRPU|nr:pentatricopeptide repeat-containing protein 1, mitochondrial [Strongylocentrotus purpuratus]
MAHALKQTSQHLWLIPRFCQESLCRRSTIFYQSSARSLSSHHPLRSSRSQEEQTKHEYSPTKRYTSTPMSAADEGEREGADTGEKEEQTFGRLSDKFKHTYQPLGTDLIDEIEEAELGSEWVKPRVKRNTPIWYGNQMKKLIKQDKLSEAIEMLEVTMLKEAKVFPTEYNFNILIGACGRAGYTDKAFKLYNKMKERGLESSSVTYTALFNACSESPWKQTDGVTRIKKLHQHLLEKSVKVNLITHHAMMKAYAKCGDLEMTFKLFRHLVESGIQLMPKSFSFLLFACAEDKEAGFLYAIEAWRQMSAQGIQPNIYTYNLLLRTTRDCSLGDMEVANRVLLRTITPKAQKTPALLTEGRAKDRRRKGERKQKKAVAVPLLTGKKAEMIEVEPLQVEDGYQEELEDDVMMELPVLKEPSVDPDQRHHVNSHLSRQRTGESRTGHSPEAGASSHWWDTSEQRSDATVMDESVQTPDSLMTRFHSVTSSKSASLDRTSTSLTLADIPNLLDISSDFSNVQSLAKISYPDQRLALLGGAQGFLENMEAKNVKPDVKSLSLLAEILPGKKQEENRLLDHVKEHKLKVDIDFYNVFIRRRTRRGDLKSAMTVLKHISEDKVYPNLRTYVNLATGCGQPEEGFQLLKEMEEAGIEATCHLYGALIGSTQKHRNYHYLIDVLKHMEAQGVLPNERVLTQLEKIAAFGQNKVGQTMRSSRPVNKKELNLFRGFYNQWLSRMKVQVPEHPWAKYRTKDKTLEDYKFHETAV